MDSDDTLRDRLSAAATTSSTRPLRAASAVRRSAERHRARRRGMAAIGVAAAAAAAVALGAGLGSQLLSAPPAQDPTPSLTELVPPSPTAKPSPTAATTEPTQTDTQAPSPPAVTQEQATAFVEGVRFELEAERAGDLDFPPEVTREVIGVQAHGCLPTTVEVAGVLAQRTAVFPGADTGSKRQLSVFADAGSAATAFADVRSRMRTCHAERRGVDEEVGVERSFVGDQLTLGDESFWVGTKDVVLPGRDLGARAGEEVYFSTAAVLVLDGATITVIDDPAHTDQGRADFLSEATGEWERLGPRIDDLGR